MRRLSVRAAFAVLLIGCTQGEPQQHQQAAPAKRTPEKVAAEHLPNIYRVHEKVISGGQPEGEAAFRELRDLGVKTVISVDGAKPDVEAARKYGLRYVHLPHGYDGVPEGRARELAKAVRDLDGPVYVHCHHGKHRSPAASAVACVSAGLLAPEDAVVVLETAGTSEHYRGLYDSAREARPLGDGVLDALEAEFPEVADLPPMAEAMVGIEHTFDRLKAIARADWRPPKDHPDLDPPHEALLLREQYTELLRTDDVKGRSERFRELLREGEAAAESLEAALREADAATAEESFDRISRNCTACHREFRDVPSQERSGN